MIIDIKMSPIDFAFMTYIYPMAFLALCEFYRYIKIMVRNPAEKEKIQWRPELS